MSMHSLSPVQCYVMTIDSLLAHSTLGSLAVTGQNDAALQATVVLPPRAWRRSR